MAALGARDLDAARNVTRGSRLRIQPEREMRVVASGGTDRERAVARPIEVEEQPAADERRVECLGAVQALFLGDREEELERAMRDLRVVGGGHRRSDADPVVRAE